jgi:NMD protein affecting ribosome stability and mRNA decay
MDKNPQYFEGTLQLRNPTQEIIDFVADLVEKKEGAWIAKTKKSKNGIDLYLSSNKFLKEIGKRLKENFPGELVHSSSLFTKNRLTSKEVHRGCVLFRYIPVKKGDIVTIRGEEIEILALGSKILGKSKETNRKVRLEFSDLR